MALDFPAGPTNGQQYTDPNGGVWEYDGEKWNAVQDPNATGGGGSGGAALTISDTAPSSPNVGDLWFDSTSGETYVWYNDGDTLQWVLQSDPHPQVGGSYEKIATTSLSSGSNIDIDLAGTRTRYLIKLRNLVQDTDGTQLLMLFRKQSDQTYRNAAGDYSWSKKVDVPATNDLSTRGNAVAQVEIHGTMNGLGTAVGENKCGVSIVIDNPRDSNVHTEYHVETKHIDANGHWNFAETEGVVRTAEDNDAVRISLNGAATFVSVDVEVWALN